MKSADSLKSGDKLRIIDTTAFKDDCQWLLGQEVEVVEVTQVACLGGYIRAKHPKEPELFLRPNHVEKVEE